jgi:hypothetical protein
MRKLLGLWVVFPSMSGHEKPWQNLPRPCGKAKYVHLTDSEPVPWGKGEKNPDEGSEIEPETVNLQAVEPLWFTSGTACLLHNEPASYFQWRGEAEEAKPQGNRVWIGRQSLEIDAKRDDLSLTRMKSGWHRMEVRTSVGWKPLGWVEDRGERPIKFRDSSFSPK